MHLERDNPSRVTKYLTRFAHNIQSTRDPGSATSTRFARLVYRLRLSRPCGSGKNKEPNATHPTLYFYAARQGLEPQFLGPKPSVLPLDDQAIIQ